MRASRVKALFFMYIFQIQQNEKLRPLVGEISWTKNIVILTKCKYPLEREFYMLHVRKFGWTKNVLIHRMKNSKR